MIESYGMDTNPFSTHQRFHARRPLFDDRGLAGPLRAGHLHPAHRRTPLAVLLLQRAGRDWPRAAGDCLPQPALSHPPAARHTVIVRQAIWLAVYAATLLWLQVGRVLTPTLVILLALGLVLVEFLLRMSERSQWKPCCPSSLARAGPPVGSEFPCVASPLG